MHIEERKVYVLVKDDGTEDIIDNPRAIEALDGIFTPDTPAPVKQEKPVRRKRAQKEEDSPTPPPSQKQRP